VCERREVLVALSREEQRLFEEIEAALSAEDPALEASLRTTGRGPIRRSRSVWRGLVFVVGLALLVAGVSIAVALSVAGFVLMLAAALAGIPSWPGALIRRLQQSPPGN
jgi:Protein of unknown function (DUF3040)